MRSRRSGDESCRRLRDSPTPLPGGDRADKPRPQGAPARGRRTDKRRGPRSSPGGPRAGGRPRRLRRVAPGDQPPALGDGPTGGSREGGGACPHAGQAESPSPIRRSGPDRDPTAGACRRRQLPGGGATDQRGRGPGRRRDRHRRRAPLAMTDREALDLYGSTGALLRGHFRLTSGLHSDVYLQSALVLQHPVHAASLGEALAARFRDDSVQTVLAPAIGGILVAHEVARALGARALFTEREDGIMRLRRGFALAPGERCLVVEDVMTTGGSIREVVACVEALGGVAVGVGSLIDRSSGAAHFPLKHAALATVKATTWKPEECPLCRAGSQAVKPGSRV